MIDDRMPCAGRDPTPTVDARWPVRTLLSDIDETALVRLGEIIALKLRSGDVVALVGDLGAGKSTLARAMIRALLDDPAAEVASPTFPLMLTYETPRLVVRHCDFYRLGDPGEVDEIGFDEALVEGAAIVEWPERAWAALPHDRLQIEIGPSEKGDDLRRVLLKASGAPAVRLDRIVRIDRFLAASQMQSHAGDARITYLQGDASPRAYARLERPDGSSAILMDAPPMPDGPPVEGGLPYSRIAHLAEDVAPFVEIARHLAAVDLSVPAILADDLADGLLLIEDLGDLTFARALASGASQETLWQAALDPLTRLTGTPPPAHLAVYDTRALTIECRLVLDWMWPALHGSPPTETVRRAFADAWHPSIDRVAGRPEGIVIRDYHSPNLMWLPDREAHRRVGILDFQDAVAGPPAYDVVSLLQDARLDVAADLERALLDRHIAGLAASGRLADSHAFRADYAILGAQRAAKILGIFVRLSRRDGKHGYLAHLPRISDYLERNLAHPALADVRRWFDVHLPAAARGALAKPASEWRSP
ncbi:MAG: tRNA (adenosine(37)-N6)-threonylcarbamoyltransferase complex ATPase subunit type 1 TsaE [Hyphomicrobiaceae bacterium]